METENHQDQHFILIELNDVTLHKLLSKQKTNFAKGTLQIVKVVGGNLNYFMILNNFYYSLSKSVKFVQIQHKDSISYLFSHFGPGLYALSISQNQETVEIFEKIIKNVAILQKFDTAIHELQFQSLIFQHCPYVEKQPLINTDKQNLIIKQIGKKIILGIKFIQRNVIKTILKVGNYIQIKVSKPKSQSNINNTTIFKSIQKLKYLKKELNKVTHFIFSFGFVFLSPVAKFVQKIRKMINKKIENSNYAKLKLGKNILKQSINTILSIFKQIYHASLNICTEVSLISGRIIYKKIGINYMETSSFSDQQQQEGDQKQQNNIPRQLTQTS